MNQQQPNLLALDTSNQYCSVALQWGTQVHARHEWSEQTHSQMILPMVRALMSEQNANFLDLDAIVVGIGPGGFTGVRLAVAVAQGLAFAAHKPVIVISSLAALAEAGLQSSAATTNAANEVIVAMDARMQQVYWAHYQRVDSQENSELYNMQALIEPRLDDVSEFVARLSATQANCVVVVGNAVKAFDAVAQACADLSLSIPEMDHSAPHASDLLPMANAAWARGDTMAPEHVQPLYVRDKVALTIAEREQK